jgi:hypothetical protein
VSQELPDDTGMMAANRTSYLHKSVMQITDHAQGGYLQRCPALATIAAAPYYPSICPRSSPSRPDINQA